MAHFSPPFGSDALSHESEWSRGCVVNKDKGNCNSDEFQTGIHPLPLKLQILGIMVAFNVEVDTSLLSLPLDSVNENCAFQPEDKRLLETSFGSARDTSHTERDVLETSRSAMHMHSSILDITEDCDEDEEYAALDGSFLFPEVSATADPLNESLDYRHPSAYQEVTSPAAHHQQHCCVPLPRTEMMTTTHDTSLLDRMTERFVETLCFKGEKELKEQETLAWETTKRSVEYDILELLGCTSAPNEDEMEQVWAWSQSILNCVMPVKALDHISLPPRPRRQSMRERASRLHRLRTERAMQGSSKQQQQQQLFQSPSPSPTSVLLQNRVRSMDDRILQLSVLHPSGVSQLEDDLEKQIGYGMEPISNCEEIELGYDSDPEEFSFYENRLEPPVKLLVATPLLPPPPPAVRRSTVQQECISTTVQDSLNQTWTLTWHQANKRPVCINAWIERGTLVQSNNRMLEPNLMWREVYQADLPKRKLNPTSKKPFNVRLLNICRILEAPATLDRAAYPTVRPSCSFLIRTSDDTEYIFQAATAEQRNQVVRRWKLCVARFATLAVLEDMPAITAEFFTPMVTSQMLVPNYL